VLPTNSEIIFKVINRNANALPKACWSSEDRAAGHELPVLATELSAWDACGALQRMEPAILPSSDAKIRRCKARRRLPQRQRLLVIALAAAPECLSEAVAAATAYCTVAAAGSMRCMLLGYTWLMSWHVVANCPGMMHVHSLM